jgi:hypothetical protein
MISELLTRYRSQDGVALADLSDRAPVLLVFLRHFG